MERDLVHGMFCKIDRKHEVQAKQVLANFVDDELCIDEFPTYKVHDALGEQIDPKDLELLMAPDIVTYFDALEEVKDIHLAKKQRVK